MLSKSATIEPSPAPRAASRADTEPPPGAAVLAPTWETCTSWHCWGRWWGERGGGGGGGSLEEEKNLDEIGTEATNCLTVRSISCGSSGGGNEYSITWGKYWTNRNLDLIDTNFTISNIDKYIWNSVIHIKIKYYQGYPLFGVEWRDGGEAKAVDSQVNL